MMPPTRKDWERLIVTVAGALEQEHIPYHLDGATALYAQGIDFDMDDLDVTVKWGCLEHAWEIFRGHSPSPITSAPSPSFYFDAGGLKVHVMAYESSSGIGDPADRVQVSVANVVIWAKTVEFYRRHMSLDHPLAKLVADHGRVREHP